MTTDTRVEDRALPPSRIGPILAILIAILAYWLWTGFLFLDPSNIGWLTKSNGDPVAQTLGWWFWRDAPWTMPPGLNPGYGIELAGSIVYSDSLPLLAFPLKLLRPLLPEIQQYWGIWLLICMILQGLFGYLLARALKAAVPVALVVAAFVCFAPPFLYRAQDHLAIAGHWVVLAALWLYASRPRPWAWVALLVATSLIHAYLLVMVGAIWMASIVQRARLKYPQVPLLIELGIGFALTVAAMWLAGFFVTAAPEGWGLGIFRLNLLSFIDPETWSLVLSDIPAGYGDYEGFAYLGLGLIALIIVALATAAFTPLRETFTARWLPLFIVLLLLLIFAFSPDPAIGPIEIAHYPLPAFIERLWAIFRSTGRMVWPAYYLLMVVVIVLIGRRFRLAVALPLMLAAFAVQVVDTWPGWSDYLRKRSEVATTWPTPFVSAFWERAPERYSRIRAIPVYDLGRSWITLAPLAATHGMTTDSAYMSRTDPKLWQAMIARTTEAVETGSLDPEAIYFVDPLLARWVARQARPEDVFGTIDGRLIFARGGADLVAETKTPVIAYDPVAPALTPGAKFDLTANRDAWPYLAGEWRDFRKGGAVAVEQWAAIQFRGAGRALRLTLSGNTRAPGLPQHVTFTVNGAPAGEVTIPDGESVVYDVPLTPHPDGNVLIDLAISEAEGPLIQHPARDFAPVGLVVTAMELVP